MVSTIFFALQGLKKSLCSIYCTTNHSNVVPDPGESSLHGTINHSNGVSDADTSLDVPQSII